MKINEPVAPLIMHNALKDLQDDLILNLSVPTFSGSVKDITIPPRYVYDHSNALVEAWKRRCTRIVVFDKELQDTEFEYIATFGWDNYYRDIEKKLAGEFATVKIVGGDVVRFRLLTHTHKLVESMTVWFQITAEVISEYKVEEDGYE